MLKNSVETETDKVNPSIKRSIGVLIAQVFFVVWTYKLLSTTDWTFFFSSLACLAAYAAIGEASIKHFRTDKALAIIRAIHLALFIAAMLFWSIAMSNAVKVQLH